ncbi:MAG TPA: hypothetical protein V6C69_17680 [Trichormus sp.]|jgi:hypothetical protein
MPLLLRARPRKKTGNMSEFPLALLVLFMLLLFPLIDVVGLAIGAATASLLANQCSTRASELQNYGSALQTMNEEANQMFSSGFANFAKLKPVGGYNNCGADLWIITTNYHNNTVQPPFGPNKPFTGGIDPSTYLYELDTKVQCQVGPVVSLASMPWIGDVPGLGKPATLNFEAQRAAEYPVGLTQSSALASNPTANGGPLRNLNIPWDSTYGVGSPNGSSWNFPGIYDAISASGSTVLDDDVILVQANNAYWTPTVFNVSPNANKISSDIRVDGQWALANGAALTANGNGTNGAFGLPDGALIAKIGLNGTPFYVGTSQVGMPLPGGAKGGGILYFGMNSATQLQDSSGSATQANPKGSPYNSFTGAQFVRIITQP